MTLYQRIYACSTVKEAKRSFYIAGLLEYPLMAFLGVILGMFARIAFPTVEAEMGMPMLLRDVLPIGVTGVVLAAYFSAIMSTADSCLIASSGNFVNDIVERYWMNNASPIRIIRVSQIITLIVGSLALFIASAFTTVLEIILHAYSFMVAGLFIPTLAAYFSRYKSASAAMLSMLGGGTMTLYLIFSKETLPFGLDASIYGILLSAVLYIFGILIFPNKDGVNNV
jgi:SSS family solute:Na+ symporter